MFKKQFKFLLLTLLLIVGAMIPATIAAENDTVTITDATGEVTVPKNPQKVVALDNRTFETLEQWGIQPVAVPKDVMYPASAFVSDDDIANVGNHREPNLEVIAAAQPDLVIVGQRFASYYEEIKALVPEATVINLDIDVSQESEDPGRNLKEGLIETTRTLGEIFDKQAEADQLIQEFEAAIEQAKAAYPTDETVMSLVVSGGNLGYAAPQIGRVWGPLYSILDWKPALEIENDSTDHKGDDISVEAIAESNPDWLMVLDRDAAIRQDNQPAQPAQDVVENSKALANTTAIKNQQIVYAPVDTYTNESIQTFTKLFNLIADAMAQ